LLYAKININLSEVSVQIDPNSCVGFRLRQLHRTKYI